MSPLEPISILWPGDKNIGAVDFTTCTEDLQLTELASLLFPGRTSAEALSFASRLTTCHPETLRYRQDCISDLLRTPAITSAFEQGLELLAEMRQAVTGIRENAEGFTSGGVMNGFKETLEKLERLFGSKSNMIEEEDLDNYYGQLFRATIFSYRLSKAYVALLTLFRETLTEDACRSDAMKQLRSWILTLCREEKVDESIKVLQEIAAVWQGAKGFSVDILVDRGFHVLGMELSSIKPQGYARPGVVTAMAGEDFDGISGLTDFPLGGATARFQELLVTELGSAMRNELFKLRSAVSNIPVSGVKALLSMDEEFSFYTGTARFCEKLLAHGAAVTCPTVSETCFMDVEGAYPVSLLLLHEARPAANDIRLPMGGTVNFITGANSSGKTTWLIAAGQLQWLYQLGCHLPCKRAAMGPTDGLFTLFASGESITGEDSRMGMEAIKLAGFRDKLTKHSMVLLNEPMTSTNAGEGIEICMDLLYELIETGVSAMMVSHYNEIYSMLRQRLTTEPLREKLCSFVMEIDQADGTIHYPYRLRQRSPDRSSHADEIVKKVGVTLQNMLEVFASAGLDVRPGNVAWSQLHSTGEEV